MDLAESAFSGKSLTLTHVDRQISKQLMKDETHSGMHQTDHGSNVEYLRNVFMKYLEYLAQSNTKEIHMVERILFTELQVSKDQEGKLNQMRQQNTFWKKYLQLGAI